RVEPVAGGDARPFDGKTVPVLHALRAVTVRTQHAVRSQRASGGRGVASVRGLAQRDGAGGDVALQLVEVSGRAQLHGVVAGTEQIEGFVNSAAADGVRELGDGAGEPTPAAQPDDPAAQFLPLLRTERRLFTPGTVEIHQLSEGWVGRPPDRARD